MSPDNSSVYVEQIGSLTEDKIRRAFDRFGAINEVRIFKLQGYAVVKFEQKDPAARAIVQKNNTEIMGRCSWGKSGDEAKEDHREAPLSRASTGSTMRSTTTIPSQAKEMEWTKMWGAAEDTIEEMRRTKMDGMMMDRLDKEEISSTLKLLRCGAISNWSLFFS